MLRSAAARGRMGAFCLATARACRPHGAADVHAGRGARRLAPAEAAAQPACELCDTCAAGVGHGQWYCAPHSCMWTCTARPCNRRGKWHLTPVRSAWTMSRCAPSRYMPTQRGCLMHALDGHADKRAGSGARHIWALRGPMWAVAAARTRRRPAAARQRSAPRLLAGLGSGGSGACTAGARRGRSRQWGRRRGSVIADLTPPCLDAKSLCGIAAPLWRRNMP